MKRAFVAILVILFLTGCSADDNAMSRPLSLREKILNNGCQFEAIVTADYGDALYEFSLDCQSDRQGNLNFTVTQPQMISGITGSITNDGGNLTFDDQMLAFSLLADDQLSPVSAPWVFLRTLRSGYIRACGKNGENYKVLIDDSYEENPLQLDIWLSEENIPIRAEILWQNRRIVSVVVNNFQFL